MTDTNSLALANFVGVVVGFLNVLIIRLRSLLLAAALSFEIEMVFVIYFKGHKDLSWRIFLKNDN